MTMHGVMADVLSGVSKPALGAVPPAAMNAGLGDKKPFFSSAPLYMSITITMVLAEAGMSWRVR